MNADELRAAGWSVVELGESAGFSGEVAPIWTRRRDERTAIGFLADRRHINNHAGTIHGGALMTFADIALGYVVVQLLGAPRCVTVQMQMQLVASPRVGNFIHCEPEILRHTSHLVFVRGLIHAGEKPVASADGIWKVLEKR